MPIKVARAGHKYTATATPPDSNIGNWYTTEPLSATNLVNELRRIGCHTTDISDAMYEADPFWLNRTDKTSSDL